MQTVRMWTVLRWLPETSRTFEKIVESPIESSFSDVQVK